VKALGAWRAIAATTATALAVTACGGGGGSAKSETSTELSDAAALGEKIFSDASLSASGKQSCASCHDPVHAHGPTNNLAVQLGGANLDVPGFRAAPSLRYLKSTPAFFFDAEGTPIGGFNLDGRADTLQAQARRPFLAPHEMANADIASVIAKLSGASYAAEFRRVFGDTIFSDAQAAFDRMTFALQRLQLEEPSFAPFSSKYDAFLAGKAQLADAELRGLALFNSPVKGNCAACHPSARGADGTPPLFTDFSYDNLGVPRNGEIAATGDASYFDLGLCGPDRTDLSTRTELCGAFKVPTLRNVATRPVFFHNGRFKSLKETLRFYVTRDTNPELWYPTINGVPDKFNDLPAAYRGNVNTSEAPYNRRLGDAPALSDTEIDDVIAFLATLSDGYTP
jgi:cytochrome c peroxidase